MQQFGFSATDVKLKQWDETPKFSNANIQPTEISSGTQMPSQLSAKASSLSQKPCPNSRVKTHPLGKIAASLKPFPKVGKYQPGMDAHAFSEENQVLVASAWGLSAAGERTGVSSKLWLSPLKSSTSRASCKNQCVNTA